MNEQVDKREFYPNKPLATTVANRLQRKFEEKGCYSAGVQLEPNKGFVVVLFCENNIPDAWDDGAEVQTRQVIPSKAPADWAAPKKKVIAATGTAASTPSAPKGGTTARVWAIGDAVLGNVGADDVKTLRAAIIQTCLDEGINKATAGTQYSKWKKAKGIS